MYVKGIKSDLKAINAEFQKECKSAVDRAHHISLSRLQPGQTAPAPGFLTPEIEAELRASVAKLSDRAQGILEDALKEVRAAKAEAPSTEAVNSVTMLRGNKHVSEEDIIALADVYGDNYLTHKALHNIALEHGYHILSTHLADTLEKGLSTLSDIYRRDLTAYEAQAMANSAWRKAAMDDNVDMFLPE